MTTSFAQRIDGRPAGLRPRAATPISLGGMRACSTLVGACIQASVDVTSYFDQAWINRSGAGVGGRGHAP